MSEASNNLAVKRKVPNEQSLPKKSGINMEQKWSANLERCVSCDKEAEDDAVTCH